MKNNRDINRRLADYIYDDMSPEDILEMEAEISQDPKLSDSYHLNMQVKDYLKAKIQLEEMRSDPFLEDAEKLADLAFELESLEDKKPQTIPFARKKNRVRTMVFTAAIAASVSIIIALGVLPSSIDQDRLFDSYYEPIEASDYSRRGEADGMYRNIALGINNYMDGNYQQSIDHFNTLASESAFRPEVQFFTGLSYLGLGRYQDAQNSLKWILEGNSRYQAEALWYLGLCHVKTGDFDEAEVLLGKLEQYDGLYKKDAQDLRRKLRRLK